MRNKCLLLSVFIWRLFLPLNVSGFSTSESISSLSTLSKSNSFNQRWDFSYFQHQSWLEPTDLKTVARLESQLSECVLSQNAHQFCDILNKLVTKAQQQNVLTPDNNVEQNEIVVQTINEIYHQLTLKSLSASEMRQLPLQFSAHSFPRFRKLLASSILQNTLSFLPSDMGPASQEPSTFSIRSQDSKMNVGGAQFSGFKHRDLVHYWIENTFFNLLPVSLQSLLQKMKIVTVDEVSPGNHHCVDWRRVTNTLKLRMQCLVEQDFQHMLSNQQFLIYTQFQIELWTALIKAWRVEYQPFSDPNLRKTLLKNNFFGMLEETQQVESLSLLQKFHDFLLKGSFRYVSEPKFYVKNYELFDWLKRGFFVHKTYFPLPRLLTLTDNEKLIKHFKYIRSNCEQPPEFYVLVVSAGAGFGMMGHTLLLSKDCFLIEDNDLVFSYGANVEDVSNFFAGVTRALFANLTFVLNYFDLSGIKYIYNRLENRTMQPYLLNLNEQQRWKMADLLVAKYQTMNPENKLNKERYALLTRNCTSELREDLAQTTQQKLNATPNSVIPFLQVGYLKKRNLIVKNQKLAPLLSSSAQWENRRIKINQLLENSRIIFAQQSSETPYPQAILRALAQLKYLGQSDASLRAKALTQLNIFEQILRPMVGNHPFLKAFYDVLLSLKVIMLDDENEENQQIALQGLDEVVKVRQAGLIL